MPTWNPAQYLKFADDRTRPCRDLAARVALESPRSIIDLGCGPGNSTAVLAERWPAARITGLDNSADMIAKASASYPSQQWVARDILAWTNETAEPYDLVFANASLQWVPDHAAAFPKVFSRVAPGGAFALQVPANLDAPAQSLMRELAEEPHWRGRFAGVHVWYSHDFDFYYQALAPHAASIELWSTEYVAKVDGVEAIVEWYHGTGLRPYLDALGNTPDAEKFLAAYLELLRDVYRVHADGKVLFPFRRLFVIAYRA